MAAWPYSTAAWQKLRRLKLGSCPWCEPCHMRGRTVAATAVDHRKAIAAGGPAFPPLSGLMSMCAPCHNAKTAAVDREDSTGFRRPLKGFAVDGNPIDSNDDWFKNIETNSAREPRVGPLARPLPSFDSPPASKRPRTSRC